MGEKIDNGDYVREYYQVPAYKGQRVRWRGQDATIVRFDLAYLVLELDGHDPLADDGPEQVTVHPTWEVDYPVPGEEQQPSAPSQREGAGRAEAGGEEPPATQVLTGQASAR